MTSETPKKESTAARAKKLGPVLQDVILEFGLQQTLGSFCAAVEEAARELDIDARSTAARKYYDVLEDLKMVFVTHFIMAEDSTYKQLGFADRRKPIGKY